MPTILSSKTQNLQGATEHTKMAVRADPWADVEFEEVQDATCLEVDDIKVLFNCFQLFDVKKQDYLLADDINEVMRYMPTLFAKDRIMFVP